LKDEPVGDDFAAAAALGGDGGNGAYKMINKLLFIS
jgi:hypothetical protein